LQPIVSTTEVISSPWEAPEIPCVDLARHVLRHADRWARHTALVDAADGGTLSYGELARGALHTAAGLAAHGLQSGDVVAIYSPNQPEFATTVLGAATAGLTTTTANPLYTVGELAHQLRDSGALLVVTTAPFMDHAREAAREAGIDAVVGYDDLAGDEPPAVAIAPDDVVLLPYSSGTTGLPKGVELTHRGVVANLVQTEALLTLGPQDTVLAVAPMYHCMGLICVVLNALCQGATVATMPRFELEAFLRVIEDRRVTASIVAPPVALALARHPMVDNFDLSSLRWLGSGAAPLDPAIEQASAERLGCIVGQGYGMSEATAAIAVLNTNDPDAIEPGTVGPLLPGVEARVIDPDTGSDLGADSEGELLIRGPQLMRGYRGRPDATAATIDADGWLHTGDVATITPDGVLRITDRLKELIKVKGFQVAPAELEGLLCAHPAVADAAVVELPDEDAGEVPKAFVVACDDVAADDLMAWVAERVAPHKRVRAVEFVDQIPKLPSGKILRRLLRDGAAAGRM
jgi:acyl-CoA synthetase (AMP-forming)/AMP-acid ligase II